MKRAAGNLHPWMDKERKWPYAFPQTVNQNPPARTRKAPKLSSEHISGQTGLSLVATRDNNFQI